MDINDLSATLAVLFAVSLATERWVAILKSMFPRLDRAALDVAGQPDPDADRPRCIAVHALALTGAWMVTAFIAGGGALTWRAFIATVPAGTVELPAPVVALLGSGGSAFWTEVVQLARAAKEVAASRTVIERLALHAQAEQLGIPLESGRLGASAPADRRTRLRMQLEAEAPARLDLGTGEKG